MKPNHGRFLVSRAIPLIIAAMISLGAASGCGGGVTPDPVLNGTVVGGGGSPIEGAIVDMALYTIATPANGAFSESWPASAVEFTIVIRAEGYNTYTELIHIEGGQVLTKQFQLTPWKADSGLTGTLSGYVQCKVSGGNLEGAVVSITGTGLSATTDKNGHYEITNVPSGWQEIVVDMEGYEQSRETDWIFDNYNNTRTWQLVPK